MPISLDDISKEELAGVITLISSALTALTENNHHIFKLMNEKLDSEVALDKTEVRELMVAHAVAGAAIVRQLNTINETLTGRSPGMMN